MFLAKWLFESGGVIFGPKGVKWNPIPTIKTLDHHLFATLQMESIPSDKIDNLYEVCEGLLSAEKITLEELSTIAGRFLVHGPPIVKLFTSELFKLMSHEFRNLAFQEKLIKIQGDLNCKHDTIQPQTYNFLNLQESPHFQWPGKGDQSQIEYQRSVQQLLKQSNTSVNFEKLKNFRVEVSDTRLYKIPIPVSQTWTNICKLFFNFDNR